MKVSCPPPGWESIDVKCTQSSGRKRSRGEKRRKCTRENRITMLKGLEKEKGILGTPKTLPNRTPIHNHNKTLDLEDGVNNSTKNITLTSVTLSQ